MTNFSLQPLHCAWRFSLAADGRLDAFRQTLRILLQEVLLTDRAAGHVLTFAMAVEMEPPPVTHSQVISRYEEA
jgi:hypothetical protein